MMALIVAPVWAQLKPGQLHDDLVDVAPTSHASAARIWP
jgi:hypothetical protein